jgi:YhcH/YjgK/YiaL family protein
MILDHIKNYKLYTQLDHKLKTAFEYLALHDLANQPEAKLELAPNSVTIQIVEQSTRSQALWESHRKYLDIHFLIRGEEKIGYAFPEDLTIQEPYSESRDLAFFKGLGQYATLRPGYFAIFYPGEAHMPLLSVHGEKPIKKAIVKVLMPGP